MSAPAELSARLRDLRDYLRMPQMVVIGPAQEIDLRHALTAEQSADTIDALQAQVEVLREGLAWALCELYALKRYMERPEAGEWGVECSVCRNEWFDPDDIAKLDEIRAALSPIKASDADRREKP